MNLKHKYFFASYCPNQSLLAAALIVATAILGGCQTTPPDTGQPEPKILSVTKSQGRGIPNGRSDSAAPFLRKGQLPPAGTPQYGYSQHQPIKTKAAGQYGHILFLNALRGPNGETIEYERLGACCDFVDPSLPMGGGLLDIYLVRVLGRDAVTKLYVDMYTTGSPQLPRGFTARD